MDPQSIISKYNLKKVSASRQEFSGPCPICGGNDRFVFFPDCNGGSRNNLAYICRKCGRHGDIAQFLIDFEKWGQAEALKATGKSKYGTSESSFSVCLSSTMPAGVPDFESGAKSDSGQKQDKPERNLDQWREMAGKIVERAHQRLFEYPEQLQYLKSRGFDEGLIRIFKLGYIPSDCFMDYEKWGLPPERNDKGNFKKLYLPQGITIPLFDEVGQMGEFNQVERIRIRKTNPKEKENRYHVVRGSGMRYWFNPDGYSNTSTVLIVESELDAMICQTGEHYCLPMAAGSVTAKPDPKADLILSQAKTILFSMDFDQDTGQVKKVLQEWKERYGKKVKAFMPATGKDPGEQFVQGVKPLQWIEAGAIEYGLKPLRKAEGFIYKSGKITEIEF